MKVLQRLCRTTEVSGLALQAARSHLRAANLARCTIQQIFQVTVSVVRHTAWRDLSDFFVFTRGHATRKSPQQTLCCYQEPERGKPTESQYLNKGQQNTLFQSRAAPQMGPNARLISNLPFVWQARAVRGTVRPSLQTRNIRCYRLLPGSRTRKLMKC